MSFHHIFLPQSNGNIIIKQSQFLMQKIKEYNLYKYRDKTKNIILINKSRKHCIHVYIRPAFLINYFGLFTCKRFCFFFFNLPRRKCASKKTNSNILICRVLICLLTTRAKVMYPCIY